MKTLARKSRVWYNLFFWIEVVGVIVGGIGVMAVTDWQDFGILIGIIILVIGFLVAWISSWMLYGYGEIVDKVLTIENNTRSGERRVETQQRAYSERINRLEQLRSQGLITEVEYQTKRTEIIEKL